MRYGKSMQKPQRLLLTLSLCLGLAIPVAALAGQSDQTTPTSGTITGSSAIAPATQKHAPGLARKAMKGIALSDAQKQQIQSLVQQYSQDHPAGSPRDKDAAKALRASLLNVLTPDQQTQYLSNLATMRKHHKDETTTPAPEQTPQP
jgi:Spy/CpxP family protein refolding chaperone